MITAVAELEPIEPAEHLIQILEATEQVLGSIQHLDASRCGPANLIEAAATDLAISMTTLAQLGPSGGHPTLQTLESSLGDRAGVIAAGIRQNVTRIREQCAGLSLELRRHLAECREVMSLATGSAGTYDALGRTTTGQMRRSRGSV